MSALQTVIFAVCMSCHFEIAKMYVSTAMPLKWCGNAYFDVIFNIEIELFKYWAWNRKRSIDKAEMQLRNPQKLQMYWIYICMHENTRENGKLYRKADANFSYVSCSFHLIFANAKHKIEKFFSTCCCCCTSEGFFLSFYATFFGNSASFE